MKRSNRTPPFYERPGFWLCVAVAACLFCMSLNPMFHFWR